MISQLPVIELNSVGRRFGTDPPLDALVGVNLKVHRGEWLSIVGPSGSGKSTLLNIVGLLDRQTSGTYFFNGIDVAELRDTQRAGLRSRAIGFVFQSFHLISHRSVLDNVMLSDVYRKGSRNDRRERAFAAVARVGLSKRADYLPSRLSGGERQRVAIARAILGSPRLLLCDEPTGNIDSVMTNSILDLFGELNQAGLTIVTITHDSDVAERASRQVHIIDGVLNEELR